MEGMQQAMSATVKQKATVEHMVVHLLSVRDVQTMEEGLRGAMQWEEARAASVGQKHRQEEILEAPKIS